ncbi:hypothetical protein HDU86_002015 [Geranomyces michiganensis]|nr:hypothetical protein HDU86_002015 [Geranomyces michiganensis]
MAHFAMVAKELYGAVFEQQPVGRSVFFQIFFVFDETDVFAVGNQPPPIFVAKPKNPADGRERLQEPYLGVAFLAYGNNRNFNRDTFVTQRRTKVSVISRPDSAALFTVAEKMKALPAVKIVLEPKLSVIRELQETAGFHVEKAKS